MPRHGGHAESTEEASDGGDFSVSKGAEASSGLKAIAATLQLFDLCQPSPDLTVARDGLYTVLCTNLGGEAKADVVLAEIDRHELLAASWDRIDFLRYWRGMDAFMCVQAATLRQSEPETIRGMQKFRDGVLELARSNEAVSSHYLLDLLGEIRDASSDQAYWDEVMRAVPDEDGFCLSVPEVSEAVHVWLRDFLQAEAEQAAARQEEGIEEEDEDDTGSHDGFMHSERRRSSANSHHHHRHSHHSRRSHHSSGASGSRRRSSCQTSTFEDARRRCSTVDAEGYRAHDLLEVISRVTVNEKNHHVKSAVAKLTALHHRLETDMHSKDGEVQKHSERAETLEKHVETLEEQLAELHASAQEVHELQGQREEVQRRADGLTAEVRVLKDQVDNLTSDLAKAVAERDKFEKEAADVHQREVQWQERFNHLQKDIDNSDGRAQWFKEEYEKIKGQLSAERNKSTTRRTQEAKMLPLLKKARHVARAYAAATLESDEATAMMQMQLENSTAAEGLAAAATGSPMDDSMQAMVDELRQTLEEKDKTIAERDAALQEREAELQKVEQQAMQMRPQKSVATKMMADNDGEIEELRRRIAWQADRLDELDEKLELKEVELNAALQETREVKEAAKQAADAPPAVDMCDVALSQSEKRKMQKLGYQRGAEALHHGLVGRLERTTVLHAVLLKWCESARRSSLEGQLARKRGELAEAQDEIETVRRQLQQQQPPQQQTQKGESEQVKALTRQVESQQAEITKLRAARDDLVTGAAAEEAEEAALATVVSGDGAEEVTFSPEHMSVLREKKFMRTQFKALLSYAKENEKLLDAWRDAHGPGPMMSPDVRRRQSIMHVTEEHSSVFNELSEQLYTLEVQKADADQEVSRLGRLVKQQDKELQRLHGIEKQRDSLLIELQNGRSMAETHSKASTEFDSRLKELHSQSSDTHSQTSGVASSRRHGAPSTVETKSFLWGGGNAQLLKPSPLQFRKSRASGTSGKSSTHHGSSRPQDGDDHHSHHRHHGDHHSHLYHHHGRRADHASSLAHPDDDRDRRKHSKRESRAPGADGQPQEPSLMETATLAAAWLANNGHPEDDDGKGRRPSRRHHSQHSTRRPPRQHDDEEPSASSQEEIEDRRSKKRGSHRYGYDREPSVRGKERHRDRDHGEKEDRDGKRKKSPNRPSGGNWLQGILG
eukprot:TRINITY_DN31048_c0_g1_i1.p1 TRINITY_DN31048_c0_g1~~TRINITY_DN31048_c0_g1_i1.p1  ORF type:complete len:1180 (+),score=362.70 TRINITY_DN31048_c0_g1_i1:400-3939(+)